ncbi:MAG: UbiA family prenyltransferase [Planctomycetia bacterium]|nr:UbiA family prenyltransferase [Planctomycetia bacterium]
MLKAWAQLVRLPNVFTAPADVIAGAALSLFQPHKQNGLPDNIVWLCLISVCYYMAGMILNDVADGEEDRRERPFRPLPSGRISKTTAITAGTLLMAVGLVIGFWQLPAGYTWQQLSPVVGLPMLILAYNFLFKNTWLGHIVMGLCRGFNLLLGTIMVADLNGPCYAAACVNTLYIIGVTYIAFEETKMLHRKRMLLGLLMIYFSTIILAGFYHRYFDSVEIPPHIPVTNYLVILLLLMPALIWIRAVDKPIPSNIGLGIKYSILGLVVINAIHATYPLGYPGLLVLLFLIPALFLGKFIYST